MGDKTKRTASRRTKSKIPNVHIKKAQKRQLADEDVNQTPSLTPTTGSSAKKLCPSLTNTHIDSIVVDKSSLGNGIVNMDLLVNFIETFKCTNITRGNSCGGSLTASVKSLGGLAQNLSATCDICGHQTNQHLSNKTTGELLL